jgi:hypothetical protein
MRKQIQLQPPEGFCYQTDFLLADEERDLADHIPQLPLREYNFHGFTAKRRVFYYGWQYDANEGRLKQIEQIPNFYTSCEHGLRFLPALQ